MSDAGWCGIAAVLGAAGLAGALTVVIRESETGIVTLAFLGMVGASVLLMGWGSLAGMRGQQRAGRAAAFAGSAVLLFLAFLSGFTVGMLFLPGGLVGIIAAGRWLSH
jgi:hypothetical protein